MSGRDGYGAWVRVQEVRLVDHELLVACDGRRQLMVVCHIQGSFYLPSPDFRSFTQEIEGVEFVTRLPPPNQIIEEPVVRD